MENSSLDSEGNAMNEAATRVWRDIADHIEILDSSGYNVSHPASELRDELLDNLVALSRADDPRAKEEIDAILDEFNKLKAIIIKWTPPRHSM